MAKTVVGLDFGSTSIRAAEVQDGGRPRATVVRSGEVPLPPGVVRDGDVLEMNTVADALKRLWQTAGFKTKDVVLGVGNHKVISRDLSVPSMPLNRIKETLAFQVQDLLPVPVDEALLDFYPVREEQTADGATVHGLLIAAMKAPVEAKVAAVRLAGLNPVAVDLVPFALTRVLLHGESAVGTSALIDVGESTTIIVVAHAGVPQFVRIVPAGGDDVTRAIAERLGIEYTEAEALKRAVGLVAAPKSPEGFTSYQYETVLEIVFSVVSEMLSGLRNTLTYYSSNGGRPIERIVLTGGVGRVEGFADALGELTRIPVLSGDPLGAIAFSKTASAAVDNDWKELAVAVGLASGTVKR
ncbi:MAG: type IV pilus assembly protein PilM [Naasia sp.]